MKKHFLIFLLSCLIINVNAQKFYFPKAYYADSISLSKNIPNLAKQVLKFYKEADQSVYQDNAFRLRIVAQQYDEALKSIEIYRSLQKSSDAKSNGAIGGQFEVFIRTKIRQQQTKESFVVAFKPTFAAKQKTLNANSKLMFEEYFEINLNNIKNTLKNLLENISSDSLNLTVARQICRAYNSANVYANILPIGKPILLAEEKRDFIINDSINIKTREGILISAIIVRNKKAMLKQPTILIFSIYNQSQDKNRAKLAALNGYVGVIAYTRGKKTSPHEIEPFEHDAHDAYEMIDWISKQPWSNGQVGMYGGSYLGFTQWAATKKIHPALKTIVPQVSVGIGVDYPMENNVFMSYMLQWIHYVHNSKETDFVDFGNFEHWYATFYKYYREGKAFRTLDTLEGRPNQIFQRWLKHPSYDSYWQNMRASKEDFAKINIPVLTITGFYDDDQLGARHYYEQHQQFNPKANHYFVIGPYNHGGAQGHPSSELRGYTIDSVANIDISVLVFDWFDFILKGKPQPSLLKNKINYQVMGSNKWKHEASMAKMNNDTLNLYLSAKTSGEEFLLTTNKGASTTFIPQIVDFTNRADSLQTIPGEEEILSDSLNPPNLANSLVFTTQAFQKSFDINGALVGNLSLSINKKDMDVLMNLYEYTADKKYHWLGHYLTRASYTKNRSERQLLIPNQKENIPINNAFFTSKRIGTGSKLVIVLGPHKSPHWQVNYGTGKDVSDETMQDAQVPLEVKWFTDSIIKIPIYKF